MSIYWHKLLTKLPFFSNFSKMRKFAVVSSKTTRSGDIALIAQLAEHIHGKDEVISSILIEGFVRRQSVLNF
jgi:hypothetical protein